MQKQPIRQKVCPCGCGRRGICPAHLKRLAGVRAQLEGSREYVAYVAKTGRRGRRRGLGPTCCAPGCSNPRIPPASYCEGCRQAGWVEEEQ